MALVDDVEGLLVNSPWVCVPVVLSSPAFLRADFYERGTGETLYETSIVNELADLAIAIHQPQTGDTSEHTRDSQDTP